MTLYVAFGLFVAAMIFMICAHRGHFDTDTPPEIR